MTGPAFLVAAVVIFGAANAVIRRMSEIGASHLVDGRNPISFCNVLFVGNLCALLLLMHLYHRQWTFAAIRDLSSGQFWAMLTVASLGTALAPALVFSALSVTSVHSVVLISRIEPPLILALSVILLNERVNRYVIGGAALSFAGVLLSIMLQPRAPEEGSMGLGNGEFWTATAAIALALSTIISKISLRDIPVGFFSIFRTMLGTIVFFLLAVALFGPHHFADVGSPFLWRWIVFYSAGIIVAGQLFWYTGLRGSTASQVSLASTLNPIAGFVAAFLVLGERPTMGHLVGGGVILAGMLLNHIGLRRLTDGSTDAVVDAKAAADTLGFKGV